MSIKNMKNGSKNWFNGSENKIFIHSMLVTLILFLILIFSGMANYIFACPHFDEYDGRYARFGERDSDDEIFMVRYYDNWDTSDTVPMLFVEKKEDKLDYVKFEFSLTGDIDFMDGQKILIGDYNYFITKIEFPTHPSYILEEKVDSIGKDKILYLDFNIYEYYNSAYLEPVTFDGERHEDLHVTKELSNKEIDENTDILAKINLKPKIIIKDESFAIIEEQNILELEQPIKVKFDLSKNKLSEEEMLNLKVVYYNPISKQEKKTIESEYDSDNNVISFDTKNMGYFIIEK